MVKKKAKKVTKSDGARKATKKKTKAAVKATAGVTEKIEEILAEPEIVENIEEAPVSREGKVRVLSIDDEEVIRSLIQKVLTKAGYNVTLAASGEEGLEIMEKETFDLAIIDLKMPGMGGMAFLGKMKELYPDTEAVILTGFGDIENAVDAMKKGAFNFVPKPFKKDTFLTIVDRALERLLMKEELEETKTAMREIENEAAKKIGRLESEIAAVEEAKKELGDHFNAIKQSLIDGTGNQGDLEKKVMSLEKVASQIKNMEGKLVIAEKERESALKKAKKMEKELSARVSGNVALGNKLDEAKDSLKDLKGQVEKEKEEADGEEGDAGNVSLGDIHATLADFRKEIEDL